MAWLYSREGALKLDGRGRGVNRRAFALDVLVARAAVAGVAHRVALSQPVVATVERHAPNAVDRVAAEVALEALHAGNLAQGRC